MSCLSTTCIRRPTCLLVSAHWSLLSRSSASVSEDNPLSLRTLARSESHGRKILIMPSPIVTQLMNNPLFGPTFTRLTITTSCEKSSWDSRCTFWHTNSASRSTRLLEGTGAHPPAGCRRMGLRSSSVRRGRKREYNPESLPRRPVFSMPSYSVPTPSTSLLRPSVPR